MYIYKKRNNENANASILQRCHIFPNAMRTTSLFPSLSQGNGQWHRMSDLPGASGQVPTEQHMTRPPPPAVRWSLTGAKRQRQESSSQLDTERASAQAPPPSRLIAPNMSPSTDHFQNEKRSGG